jgi:hypothetical protein
MSVAEIAQLISAVGGVTSPIVIVLLARQGAQMNKVEKATDGLVHKLLDSTQKAADATGRAEGRAEGHAAGLEQGREEK